MTTRKGILVRFPTDVLADIDVEVAALGKSRNAVIVDRCRWNRPAPALVSDKGIVRVNVEDMLAPTPSPLPPTMAKRAPIKPGPGASISVQVGPACVPPGSRLKQKGKKP